MDNICDVSCSVFELSDFMECKSLFSASKKCSISDLRASFSAPDDELDINGTEEGDDRVISKLQDALGHASERYIQFSYYPFRIDRNSIESTVSLDSVDLIYVFLLFANRLNMQTNRIKGGQDATELFERLCRIVAMNYLGEHSVCEILGTSIDDSFEDKIKKILKVLNISGIFTSPLGSTGRQKDGGIDLVAWIPFKDKKDSQLIALGQCKTGSNWEPLMKRVSLFQNFSTKQPIMEPIYMFFIAEDFGSHKWEERCRSCGILFDRRRILEYIPSNLKEIYPQLFSDIKMWVTHAMGICM